MSRALPPARRPATVPAGIGVLLGLAMAVPAGAAAAATPDPDLPVATADLAPAAATALRDDVADLPLDDGGAAIVTERTERLIAPGLELTEFARVSAAGWLSGEVLVAHLGQDDGPRLGYLGPDAVAGNATVSEMAADRGAVAAVNGDFFDINNSGAALGAAVDDGTLLKSAAPGREKALTVDSSGVARLAELFLEGTVSFGSGAGARELPVAGLNVTGVPAGGVAVFDAAWGDVARTRPLGAGEQGVEVQVRTADGATTGTVVSVGTPGAGRLPADVRAVVARPGAAADALKALAPGAEVSLAYGLREDLGEIRTAIGGDPDDWLLEDGEVTSSTSDFATLRHPRTAVGISADGGTAYLVVVDGRQAQSIGASLPELGRFLGQLGADDAINLDGGGSTTMVARLPGDAGTSVLNSPSDGTERLDANGLGLFTPEGSGEVHGFDVRAAVPTGDAPATDALRVFPGLHRTLTAAGFDETRAAVDTRPDSWTTSAAAATVARGEDGAGVVTGVAAGTTTVRAAAPASDGVATGSADLTVLGEPVRLTVPEPVVTLPDDDATASLTVVGHDADGYSAPVEARDVEVTGGDGVAALEPAADGSFTVRALRPSGAASFTLAVGDEKVEVAVAVSLEDVVVADLTDAARWTSAHDRAAGGSVAPAAGHDGAAGLKLTYDFTQSTATRGQYAVAPDGGIVVAGQPRKVTMWVDGDEQGAWLRLQVRQGDGVVTNLDGPTVSWKGWRQVEFAVPEGVAYPLAVQRVRVLETRAASQYKGALTISDVRALVPPDVDAPPAERVEDPVVVAEGATDDAPLRVAVLSDAQFVARDPGSGAVQGAKQALAEIVAEDPDLLVINGDLVDEASPADFDLAREVLDEGLADADFPWYYLPGNHEVMGGSIENFEDEFGERTHVVDVPDPRDPDGGTTRLVMLDSSSGRLGSDFAQLRALRDALDDAASDDAVTGVVTLFHHPLDDPLPTKASQLQDRVEARTLRAWFEDFRETSGKQVASVGSHVGVFHAGTEDGIPYVVNGNSGKSPASTPADGGFTGWSMVGIDPAARGTGDGGWFSWEVNARAASVAVSGPEELAVGTSGQVSALLTQDGTREVPVAWPVSSRWGGDRVFVGSADDAPRGTVLALDPVTHEATAVAPGRATVEVEVNGVVGTREVLVPAGAPGQARISDDNGWDTGLRDGDYDVLVDLWWGENATSMRLYEDGALIHTEKLTHGGTGAQRVAVPVTGRRNGAYEYTCELVNAAGTTPCAGSHTVRVTDANPGTPTLSHDNGDGDGDYAVTMHKWWGTQATGYVLYEDGVEVDRQELVPGTGGDAQSATTVLTARVAGTHRYVAVLTNAAGETRSKELTVRVR